MLIDGRVHKIFKLDDLSSLVSFEEWLKKRLDIYSEDQKVPGEDLKTFLLYIKERSKEQRVRAKREWFDTIDKLIERVDDQ
jgi:hypothetical protein